MARYAITLDSPRDRSEECAQLTLIVTGRLAILYNTTGSITITDTTNSRTLLVLLVALFTIVFLSTMES